MTNLSILFQVPKDLRIFLILIIIYKFAFCIIAAEMKTKIYINKSLSALADLALAKEKTFVIIDNNLKHLSSFFKDFPQISFASSEHNKVMDTIGEIAGKLLHLGADRDALIIGVGGGITTDITGFISSIYKRGVKFAFVPTTLLSQVDASIGGKNGVNFQSYKNILGTITQPEWIYICPELLSTLPQDEFKAGIAEVLKTFILFDKVHYHSAVEYFSAVADEYALAGETGATYGEIATRVDMEKICEIIGKCAQYKCGVVERDEFERGERRLLNLGHTFAHSVEKLAGGEISHGYAVAIGMVIAARIACSMGVAKEEFAVMLAEDLHKCGLPAALHECTATSHLKIRDLADAIRKDKKVTGNNIHFILPKGLEDVEDIVIPIETLKNICNDLC